MLLCTKFHSDYNRTIIVTEIITELKSCIKPDFVLINTHQLVDDKLPYKWNKDTIKINMDYAVKHQPGASHFPSIQFDNDESLEAADCRLIADFATNKTSVRLTEWELEHKLFINDEFVCIEPKNVTYVNEPFISNGELLGFLTMHPKTEKPRITLLRNQNKWIIAQIAESNTITRTGWYHYSNFANVMLIVVFILVLISAGYQFKLTLNKEVCDVELQRIREANCVKQCYDNDSLESLPPSSESK